MMLAYSKDSAATALAYASGHFFDKKRRSFIDFSGHEHLRGVDRSQRREELFKLRKGICEHCGRYRDENHGNMHHKGKSKTRCECLNRTLANGEVCTGIQWVCGMQLENSCHRQIHNREIKSGRAA